ncbi:lipoprotein insertase outer membrane protein LolB [Ramlibacter humi]|uniref:Outer-membrane lipoprotein LolB n=1 Tax=Ramlibacter humi TaxID=2530451 RepID=A0A4Z0BZK9_9BURK|nr:lipoprotein insertase outer membrane protein LolB [Ramlibacter humi]TFZ03720.1 outer membrane lipoprotein LolB [Ramlibacter humi]
MTPRVIGAAARRGSILLAAALLAACAQLPRPAEIITGGIVRSGRLALSVPNQPQQSFSAAFELRGKPEAGLLVLFTPIGGTAAQLRWQPGQAVLQVPGQPDQSFSSLDAMVEKATGAPVPVAALFDWLAGVNTPVSGWEADLSALAEGRLRAQRRDPPPPADLRVVLDGQ